MKAFLETVSAKLHFIVNSFNQIVPSGTGKRKLLFLSLILALLTVVLIACFSFYSAQNKKITPSENEPDLALYLSPFPVTGTIEPTTTAGAKKSYTYPTPNTARANPTLAPASTPTPIPPTRTPNPPLINITYPSEMQSISIIQDQTLCVVDVPAGGNTQGLQRKYQLNDGGWSSYASVFTLCLEPKEGLNRLQLQYKNGDGDESTMYTRQFNFHSIAEINISLNGQLYRDVNCNGIRDSGENGTGTTATINIFKMPEFYIYSTITSDSNGSYSFSGKINESDSLTLRPVPISPSGYKSNPHYTEPSITFSSSNRSSTVDMPQVPNENVGFCQ
jgi:hypothetical protein